MLDDRSRIEADVMPADPAVGLLRGDLGPAARADQIRAVTSIETAAAVQPPPVRMQAQPAHIVGVDEDCQSRPGGHQ